MHRPLVFAERITNQGRKPFPANLLSLGSISYQYQKWQAKNLLYTTEQSRDIASISRAIRNGTAVETRMERNYLPSQEFWPLCIDIIFECVPCYRYPLAPTAFDRFFMFLYRFQRLLHKSLAFDPMECCFYDYQCHSGKHCR